MKTVRTAVRSLGNARAAEEEQTEHITVGRHHFFAIKKPKEELRWVKVTGTIIGKGGFGTVTGVEDLPITAAPVPADEALVFKVANNAKMAKADLQTEYATLHALHKKRGGAKRQRGIQTPPKKLVVVDASKGSESLVQRMTGKKKEAETCGYLATRYDSDLSKCLGDPYEVRIERTHDLLSGLAFLAKNNVAHKDIKLQNILVKKEEDGSITTDISDFGGASELSWELPEEFPFKMVTPPYVSNFCYEKAGNAWGNDDAEGMNKALLRNDVFAMGVVLHGLFSNGKYPCNRNTSGFAKDADLFSGVTLQDSFGVSAEITAVIGKMLDVQRYPNYSAVEALREYEEALKKAKNV